MKLLIDANLSWRLVKPLQKHFIINHVLDFFKHNERDSTLWDFAKKQNYIIVTNDEDFVHILLAKGWPPKVVLIKTGNQSNDFIFNLLISKKTDLENFYKNDDLGLLIVA
jgi:predicted nuclease of predicted toxin-antitoxin system